MNNKSSKAPREKRLPNSSSPQILLKQGVSKISKLCLTGDIAIKSPKIPAKLVVFHLGKFVNIPKLRRIYKPVLTTMSSHKEAAHASRKDDTGYGLLVTQDSLYRSVRKGSRDIYAERSKYYCYLRKFSCRSDHTSQFDFNKIIQCNLYVTKLVIFACSDCNFAGPDYIRRVTSSKVFSWIFRRFRYLQTVAIHKIPDTCDALSVVKKMRLARNLSRIRINLFHSAYCNQRILLLYLTRFSIMWRKLRTMQLDLLLDSEFLKAAPSLLENLMNTHKEFHHTNMRATISLSKGLDYKYQLKGIDGLDLLLARSMVTSLSLMMLSHAFPAINLSQIAKFRVEELKFYIKKGINFALAVCRQALCKNLTITFSGANLDYQTVMDHLDGLNLDACLRMNLNYFSGNKSSSDISNALADVMKMLPSLKYLNINPLYDNFTVKQLSLI